MTKQSHLHACGERPLKALHVEQCEVPGCGHVIEMGRWRCAKCDLEKIETVHSTQAVRLKNQEQNQPYTVNWKFRFVTPVVTNF